jgi:hypothetical protein
MSSFIDQYFYITLFIYGIIRILFLVIPFVYKFTTIKNETLLNITTNDIVKLSNSIEKLSDIINTNEKYTIREMENIKNRVSQLEKNEK